MVPLSRSFFAAATEVAAAEQIRQGWPTNVHPNIWLVFQLQFNLTFPKIAVILLGLYHW